MTFQTYLAFKQYGNKIHACINNRCTKQIPIDEFTDHTSIELSFILHNFLSEVPVNEDCKMDGAVIITSTIISDSERIIDIWVGTSHTSVTFSDIGKKIFYDDIIKFMLDYMYIMDYEKFYKKNTIWNLWGLLK
jgi:hypothetical protein